MVVTLELPEELVAKIVPPGTDLSRVALEALAAEAYRQDRLSAEQLRRLLGFDTRMQVDEFLGAHKIYDYTAQDLEADRASLDFLLGTRELTKA
ncbi:MAG: UPF0175 family protein [Bryobacteraceae bacterium]|nr:UPF0175 family protein [Bryobacteraceae bacterium]